MTVTADSHYRGVCRISREKFRAIAFARFAQPVLDERDPGEYHDAIMAQGCDPLFVLRIFKHESSYGRAGVAVTTRSWGNTRSPSFGATPVMEGGKPKEIPGRTGTFPAWHTWLDGAISTAARLTTPDWYYAREGRTIGGVFIDPHNRTPPIVWAPAGDMNDPDGYLRDVLNGMNADADMEEERQPMPRPLRIALSSGHLNHDGGNPLEASITPKLTEAYWRAFRAAGCDVRVVQGDADGDGAPGDAMYQGGLQDVARQVVRWAAEGWIPDLYLETHTEGVGNPNVRGVFAIYPDAEGDVDADVRDRLGPAIANRIAAATGLPVRGNGTMSEKSTGVGAQGWRLGVFLASTALKGSTTRLIVEHGAHSSPDDLAIIQSPEFPDKAAAAAVAEVLAFYGRQAEAPAPETPAPGPPEPMEQTRYFPETGYHLGGGFRAYWEAYGDEAVWLFGYPISNELNENGLTVQYFERVRFEWHPGVAPARYDVLLGRLGAERQAA